MPRYKLTVEYDGTPYVGWQRQKNGRGVQTAIEEAIARFCQEDITMQVAGRTDAGVHGLGQVCHADLTKEWPEKTVRDAINSYLLQNGEPVSILSAEKVTEEFHARFSAKARHYRYRIINQETPVALARNRGWWVRRHLDEEAMHDAAQNLLGTHDFTTFRAAQCQAQSPVKTLDKLDVARHGNDIFFEVYARSFLHNQVRSMVGALKLVGERKWSSDDLVAALEAKDHQRCGALAPSCGLYLTQVDYD
jgi:tRNA pseudouridine38-40 synthase